jgi:DNA-binding MarR family transcriptional regulator
MLSFELSPLKMSIIAVMNDLGRVNIPLEQLARRFSLSDTSIKMHLCTLEKNGYVEANGNLWSLIDYTK